MICKFVDVEGVIMVNPRLEIITLNAYGKQEGQINYRVGNHV